MTMLLLPAGQNSCLSQISRTGAMCLLLVKFRSYHLLLLISTIVNTFEGDFTLPSNRSTIRYRLKSTKFGILIPDVVHHIFVFKVHRRATRDAAMFWIRRSPDTTNFNFGSTRNVAEPPFWIP